MPKILDNFSLKSKKFLDSRMSFKTKALMNDYDKNSLPSGMLSYCLEDNKYYSFNGTEWKELSLDSLKISADPANKATLKADGLFVGGVSETEINKALETYKQEVTTELAKKANVTDLANKLDSTALDTYKGEVTTSLAQKLDITTAETTYATKAELNQANVNISSEANNKLVKKTDGLFVDAVSNTDLTTKLADYTTTTDLTTKLTAKLDSTALETYKQEVTASLSNKVEQTVLTTTLEQYLKKDQIGQVGGGITATWTEDTKTFTLKGITLAQI